MRKPSAPTLNIPILLRYRDSGGEVSDRLVLVDTFELRQENGVPVELTHLKGVCTLRRARRTFRVNRIVHAADPDTGEIIGNLPKWLAAEMDKLQLPPGHPPARQRATQQPLRERTVVGTPAETRPPPPRRATGLWLILATMAALLVLLLAMGLHVRR